MGLDVERLDESGSESASSLPGSYKRIGEFPETKDPVVRQWNMYMNVSPDTHVILLRYPEEQKDDPYSSLKRETPIEFRIKPISGLIEVDLPINPHAEIFDKMKGIIYGEAMRKSKIMKERGGSYGIAGGFGLGGSSIKARPGPGQPTITADKPMEELLENYDEAIRNGHVMTKVTLGGHINVWNETSPNMYVGHFEGANVYFTKVDALCVLRPQLIHLDAVNDVKKATLRMQSGADTEENEAVHVNLTIKKSEGDTSDSVGDTSEVAKLLKAMREEPWQRLSWVEFSDSYDKFNNVLTPPERLRRSRLTCNLTNEQWLDAISCPRIDPINPYKSTMRAAQKEDDLSGTEASEGEEEGAQSSVLPSGDAHKKDEVGGKSGRKPKAK